MPSCTSGSPLRSSGPSQTNCTAKAAENHFPLRPRSAPDQPPQPVPGADKRQCCTAAAAPPAGRQAETRSVPLPEALPLKASSMRFAESCGDQLRRARNHTDTVPAPAWPVSPFAAALSLSDTVLPDYAQNSPCTEWLQYTPPTRAVHRPGPPCVRLTCRYFASFLVEGSLL